MQEISQIRHGRKIKSMQLMSRRKRIFLSKKIVSSLWKNALWHYKTRQIQKIRNFRRTKRMWNLPNYHFETELDKSLETLSKVSRFNPEIAMSTLQEKLRLKVLRTCIFTTVFNLVSVYVENNSIFVYLPFFSFLIIWWRLRKLKWCYLNFPR